MKKIALSKKSYTCLQALLMLSGIMFPIMKCKNAAEMGPHACKPGLRLSWTYIIKFITIATIFCTSMVALHINQQWKEDGSSPTMYVLSVVAAATLSVTSFVLGIISHSTWLEDFCHECAQAAAQQDLRATYAEQLLERYQIMSKSLGGGYCFVFGMFQVLSILSLYNAISG
jgi:hypothetical protein